MRLFDFFKFNFFGSKIQCEHSLVTPEVSESYCPDCGLLVRNEWFITRCDCCGVKQRSLVLKNQIRPENNYCKNCGACAFVVERVEKINFIDISYAVLLKKEVTQNLRDIVQTWVDENSEPIKMISEKLS